MNKLLPLLLLLALSGCKKDDNTTDLLTQSWQTTAVIVKIADGSTISRDISSCDNNRIYTFQKDGSFLNEPTPGCISSGPAETYNGTWTLIDKKILKVEAQGGSSGMYLDSDIVMLTKSKLVLRTWITPDSRAGVRSGGGGGFAGSKVITEFSAR